MNKPTFIGIGVAAVLAVSVAWAGRAAWRTHKGLVSLHVRNASITDVIHQLESQTHQKIQLDKKLDGLVTLNVDGQPLPVVLDKVSEQTGSSWTTIYAVYDSKAALRALESALRGEQKVEEAGWKVIAPAGMTISGAGPDVLNMLRQSGGGTFTTNFTTGSGEPVRMIVRHGGPAGLKTNNMAGGETEVAASDLKLPPGAVMATEDAVIENGGPNTRPKIKIGQGNPARVIRVVRRASNGDAATSEEEIWSPVEVMLESQLSAKLGEDFSGVPSLEAASEAAKKVNGHVQTYYVVKKSALGNVPGLALNLSSLRKRDGSPPSGAIVVGNTNLAKMAAHIGPSTEDLEAAVRQHRLEELGKLTPEQRVQRARERQAMKQNVNSTSH